MGLVQGITQGVQTSHAAKDLARANNELTRRMSLAGKEYENRRPQMAADRMKALRQQLGVYNPANSMVSEMTGGRYSLDLNAPGQSPLGMKPTLEQANRGEDRGFGGAGVDPGWQQRRIDELRAQGYDTAALEQQRAGNVAGVQRDRNSAKQANALGASAIRNGASSVTSRVRGK